MDVLFKNSTTRELLLSDIGVITVDGRCFKRYLEIAKVLRNKVAVITDNDGNYAENITINYSEYTQNQFPNIRIFSDSDDMRKTFEICLYNDNREICETEFQTSRRRIGVLEYMLKNKADAAYILLKNRADELIVPQYIQDASIWIDA